MMRHDAACDDYDDNDDDHDDAHGDNHDDHGNDDDDGADHDDDDDDHEDDHDDNDDLGEHHQHYRFHELYQHSQRGPKLQGEMSRNPPQSTTNRLRKLATASVL